MTKHFCRYFAFVRSHSSIVRQLTPKQSALQEKADEKVISSHVATTAWKMLSQFQRDTCCLSDFMQLSTSAGIDLQVAAVRCFGVGHNPYLYPVFSWLAWNEHFERTPSCECHQLFVDCHVRARFITATKLVTIFSTTRMGANLSFSLLCSRVPRSSKRRCLRILQNLKHKTIGYKKLRKRL